MPSLREAATQALEALEVATTPLAKDRQEVLRAQAALRAALAEQRLTDMEQEMKRSIESLKAALEEPVLNPAPGYCKHCKQYTIEEPLPAEPVQPVACEPQYANEDGWCDWVCPKPRGYLMQCCDCGLIHEVDSRVAKYQPRPSEEFEVVDDPDLQVQWRMKRRDDISPKRKPLTEDEIALIVADCSASAHRQDDFHFARAIERAHGIT